VNFFILLNSNDLGCCMVLAGRRVRSSGDRNRLLFHWGREQKK